MTPTAFCKIFLILFIMEIMYKVDSYQPVEKIDSDEKEHKSVKKDLSRQQQPSLHRQEFEFPLPGKSGIMELFPYYHAYPSTFTIPRGGLPGGNLLAHPTEPCVVPSFQNAELKCLSFPLGIYCTLNCSRGYALQNPYQDALTFSASCTFMQGIWRPQDFDECEPYLNCKATLVKPGELVCGVSMDGTPDYCEISCDKDKNNEATNLQKYECVNNTFESTLPHCAALEKISLIEKL